MKITSILVRTIAEPGGLEYVVVRLQTDDGQTGYGETHAQPSAQVAADRATRELQPLVGADPLRFVKVDEDLRRAGASLGSRAAANVACLDIQAQASKASVHEILGGPTRSKVRAMATVRGDSLEELLGNVLAAREDGYRAFSIPLNVPDGMERGRTFYTDIRDTMDSLREAAGSDCDFVLDCGGRTSPGEALSISDRMEDFHLLWLDEPCGNLSAAAQASVSKGAVTPVGFGRTFPDNSKFQDLLREDGIDVLRPAISLHGVSTIRKAAALAETYYVAVAPFHRGGPIGTAAGLQLCASLPNSFLQENPYTTNSADRQMRAAISGWDEQPVEGFFGLPTEPGLGLRIDESALEAHTVAR